MVAQKLRGLDAIFSEVCPLLFSIFSMVDLMHFYNFVRHDDGWGQAGRFF
jgi:hypothetical protein